MEPEKEFLQGFEECFAELKDPRQQSKIDHPLTEILFLSLTALAGGATSWEMIEEFGKAHSVVLREYYEFKSIPSDDTIRRVYERLDHNRLGVVLQKYFGGSLEAKHLAIDGKTLRGSKREDTRALHFLNLPYQSQYCKFSY